MAFFDRFPSIYILIFLFSTMSLFSNLYANEDSLDARIASLSLEEKVAQLFFVGLDHYPLKKSYDNFLKNYPIGGLVLVGTHFSESSHVLKISELVQELYQKRYLPSPIWIAVDQEGGTVQRIKKGVRSSPSQQKVGAHQNIIYPNYLGRLVGHDLAALGVHINLAPVLAVTQLGKKDVLKSRSLGANPDQVADMAVAYMKGLQSHSVLATAKHFPGLGGTTVDSHLGMTISNHSFRYLDWVSMTPFKKMIQNGVSFVMVGHAIYPALDQHKPATLSYPIVTTLLRNDLEFKGVIITDDLTMGAITKKTNLQKAAIQAFQAGVDMAMIIAPAYELEGVIQAVHQAVRQSDISETQIDQSLRRVLKLKEGSF